MKQTSVVKGIFILLMAILTGMVCLSCDEEEPSKIVPVNPDPEYKKVVATTYNELVNYLSSASTSYEISLGMAEKNLYFQTDITISTNMKIIGSPNNIYTIHSKNSSTGNLFYCLNLQADLELQYCEFIGYDVTSASSGGIEAGSPPILIRENKSLTIGKDAAFVLHPYVLGLYNATYSGGTLVVDDGGSYRNETGFPDILFDTGISSLVVKKNGTAVLQNGITSIGGINPTFEIEAGTFSIERHNASNVFILDGLITMRKEWTLDDGQTLHIKSGELEVQSGALLKATDNFGEAILDGNIRLASGSALYIYTNPFPKLKGSGAIVIDNTTGFAPVVAIPDPVIGGIAALALKPLTNGRLEISSAGWKLTRITTGAPAQAELSGAQHIVADGLSMVVDLGVTLNVKHNLLVIRGANLDVQGTVNVDSPGKLIIMGGGQGWLSPGGSLKIDGSVTVDNGGTLMDTTTRGGEIFKFPAYDGAGTLIFKHTETSGIGQILDPSYTVATPPALPTPVINMIGGFLALDQGATFEVKKGSSLATYTLTGKATLTLPEDIDLLGDFILSANVPTTTNLTIRGDYKLDINYPNLLRGPTSGTETALPTIEVQGDTEVSMNQNGTSYKELFDETLAGTGTTYRWNPAKPPADWTLP